MWAQSQPLIYALYFSPTFFNVILICGGVTKHTLKNLIFTGVTCNYDMQILIK